LTSNGEQQVTKNVTCDKKNNNSPPGVEGTDVSDSGRVERAASDADDADVDVDVNSVAVAASPFLAAAPPSPSWLQTAAEARDERRRTDCVKVQIMRGEKSM
jgi:hypothetical protein